MEKQRAGSERGMLDLPDGASTLSATTDGATGTEALEAFESASPPAGTPDPSPGGRRTIVTGGLWAAASQLLPTIGVTVLGVIAARLLGADALGRQSLIAYCNSALGMTLQGGLTRACLRTMGYLQGSGDEEGLRRFTRWTTRAHVFAGTLVFGTMTLAGLAQGHDLPSWMLIGAVSIIDAAVMGVAIRVLLREGWAPLAKIRLVVGLLGPPIGIAAVLAGSGIIGIFAGDAVAAFLMMVVVFSRYRGVGLDGEQPGTRTRVGFRPPQPIARLWLLFSTNELIAQVVTKRVEFIVLTVLSTDRQVGMYSIAFMVVNLISMVPNMVAGAALPVIATADGAGSMEAATRHVKHALRLGTLISLPLTGLVAACGPPMILFVYGHQYLEAARLVPLAGLVLLASVPTGLTEQFWAGQGRVRVIIVCGLIAAVVDIGLAIGLVPVIDAGGAVVANIAGQAALSAGLLLYTARKTGPVGWHWRNLAAMAVASAAGAGVGHALAGAVTRGLGEGALQQLLAAVTAGVSGTVVLVAVCVVVKVLTPEDVRWLDPLLPGPARKALTYVTLPERAHAA
jgi:O-antigen/teichoic acid export membrane protein